MWGEVPAFAGMTEVSGGDGGGMRGDGGDTLGLELVGRDSRLRGNDVCIDLVPGVPLSGEISFHPDCLFGAKPANFRAIDAKHWQFAGESATKIANT